jgi:hypothetical protein
MLWYAPKDANRAIIELKKTSTVARWRRRLTKCRHRQWRRFLVHLAIRIDKALRLKPQAVESDPLKYNSLLSIKVYYSFKNGKN